jgi:BolA protein
MEGGGHFSAIIVSDVFEGKSPVQRHQLVYRALGDMMQKEIHAFSIKAFTPLEFQRKGNP